MKLTVEAVAKMTGLSASTVRQYAWERKIGTKEGRLRVFTIAEAKRLGGLKEGTRRKRPRRKAVAKPRASHGKVTVSPVNREPPRTEARQPELEKRSFWSFLGIGRKPKPKVNLMEARNK